MYERDELGGTCDGAIFVALLPLALLSGRASLTRRTAHMRPGKRVQHLHVQQRHARAEECQEVAALRRLLRSGQRGCGRGRCLSVRGGGRVTRRGKSRDGARHATGRVTRRGVGRGGGGGSGSKSKGGRSRGMGAMRSM
eukprot:jgi/Ulvmu1/11334/UM074_0049.1